MPRGLRLFLGTVDMLMLVYWAVTALAAAGFVALSPSVLYKGYDQPLMVAWNWSFMPLDVAFALTGLASIRLARAGDTRWRGYAIVSLTLTMCAGGMAIGFWALTRDFDPGWWIPNLILLLGPPAWLPRLLR